MLCFTIVIKVFFYLTISFQPQIVLLKFVPIFQTISASLFLLKLLLLKQVYNQGEKTLKQKNSINNEALNSHGTWLREGIFRWICRDSFVLSWMVVLAVSNTLKQSLEDAALHNGDSLRCFIKWLLEPAHLWNGQ